MQKDSRVIKTSAPPVSQINAEYVTQLSNKYWAPHVKNKLPFDSQVRFAIRKIMLLEFSQYLESYLWPNYTPEASSNGYLMSICCIVNEKFRENVPAWEVFKKAPTHFPHFFKCVMESCLSGEQLGLPLKEQTVLLLFLDHCFNSLVSYQSLAIVKGVTLARSLSRCTVSMEKVHYCERFIEFMIDLEALLPTRRWFNTVLDDAHLVVNCQLSHLTDREKEGHLFCQLLDMLKFYTGFEISESCTPVFVFQRAAFAHFPELNDFALSNVAAVDTRESLTKHFGHLSPNTLHRVSAYLCLLPELPDGEDTSYDKEFLYFVLVSRHERRISQIEQLNQMPLYPTEKIIWDQNIVPTEYYSGEGCLALPKLNLQFLTLHDYLLRNFNLFRLESTYEIRQDIEDVVLRMKPWQSEYGGVVFGGWARMAQTIASFSIVEVAKPNIGENWPARVRADVTINLNIRNNIKNEWEGLRKHDVCFLITVRPNLLFGTRFDRRQPFVDQAGLVYVRGCEVQGMLDDKGRVIEEGPDPKPKLKGDTRTFRIWLDPNQYQQDMTNSIQNGAEDPYETFNIIMRRKPKENNFKAVLETIRNLMNTECVVPDWLHDIILGYGDPGSAHYSKMPNQIPSLDFNDTFLSIEHLKSCFPNHTVKVTEEDPARQVPPFRIRFPAQNAKGKKRKANEEEKPDEEDLTLVVEPHVIPNRGPYPYNQPKRNTIQFTSTQIEAIRAGMQPGLTMVVGPPGTGKTDVAVQIISNLYHNFPEQRTLIVTHSNQALNQLFEKIMALDIDERHLLRLGHGEEELETEKDFSRYGRVNYVLSRRLELLREVARLQESLDVPGDVSYTCETAGHFYLYQVMSRWEEYMSKVKPKPGREVKTEDVASHFPFHKYFSNAPQPVFKGQSYQDDMDIAEGCYRHIRKIFTQLEVGLKLGRKKHNLLQDGYSRLKRWIMIGDHHQLPPVIKNMAFQKYSNMEQSLFTRFVRLGVPTVDLDAQGRARASLCNLYNWRYKQLGNLPHVQLQPEFQTPNPGFTYDFQLVNVEDFNGVGESEPNPYFYQVSSVTTVDRFQGQQNDYIILSLVRTKAVGHLRDVRRLVVAMSRARLGLYIFARVSLFQNCYELTPAFSQLTARPLQLHIRPHQYYSSVSTAGASHLNMVVKNMPEMANLVYNMYMHMIQSMQQHRQQLLDPPRQLLSSEEPMEADEERPETPSEEQQPTAINVI
uniref:Intron-binding protein aquarius n=1 Tax=Sinocyclocheilus grahami TaxID=75366 RepID=A0A672MSB9_SINGR